MNIDDDERPKVPKRGSKRKCGLMGLPTDGAETAAAWQMMLEDLAARHLGRPRQVISDGNPGLKSALERLWPGVAHQRCTVHNLRNLLWPRLPSMRKKRCMRITTRSSILRIERWRSAHATTSWPSGENLARQWPPAWKRRARNCSPSTTSRPVSISPYGQRMRSSGFKKSSDGESRRRLRCLRRKQPCWCSSACSPAAR